MARNFKRDRKGRFAKVAGMRGSNPRSVKPSGANKSTPVKRSSLANAHRMAKAQKRGRNGSSGAKTARNALIATAAVAAGSVVVGELDRLEQGSPLKFVDNLLLAERRRGAYNITTLPRRR